MACVVCTHNIIRLCCNCPYMQNKTKKVHTYGNICNIYIWYIYTVASVKKVIVQGVA